MTTTDPETRAIMQRSLKAPISCVGIGLHTGKKISTRLLPAGADHGIVFRRTDLGAEIPARHDLVIDSRLCTVLAHPEQADCRVGTVEHLMAAFAGLGIDNAVVEVDGPELPILDGSAQSFVFLIDCAGTVAQDSPRRTIEILRPVGVADGPAFAELRPAGCGLEIKVSIDFPATAIGRQSATHRLGADAFRRDIAPARTFTLLAEVDAMRRAGLALGGSLENAIVVDGTRILNCGGLHMGNEFARHKLLDVIGDLALAGTPIRGQYIGHRPGHALNNRLLRALLGDLSAWRYASMLHDPEPSAAEPGFPSAAAA